MSIRGPRQMDLSLVIPTSYLLDALSHTRFVFFIRLLDDILAAEVKMHELIGRRNLK